MSQFQKLFFCFFCLILSSSFAAATCFEFPEIERPKGSLCLNDVCSEFKMQQYCGNYYGSSTEHISRLGTIHTECFALEENSNEFIELECKIEINDQMVELAETTVTCENLGQQTDENDPCVWYDLFNTAHLKPILESNVENILVAKLSFIPTGPYPKLDEQCEILTVQPELNSAKLISGKGWKITSQVVYGPYEIVSFAGQFNLSHTLCVRDQTNIAIFHKGILLGLIYTPEDNSFDLGSLELLETSEIAIYPSYVYDKNSIAVLTFRNNKVSIDKPTYSMACATDGIIPDIHGLDIEAARNSLFDYGWMPQDGKKLEDMEGMQFWYSELRAKTPELRTCGGGGFLRCYYNYENKNSYLEVITSGEPQGTVSGVTGSCK